MKKSSSESLSAYGIVEKMSSFQEISEYGIFHGITTYTNNYAIEIKTKI
jgi:hypothetical protein